MASSKVDSLHSARGYFTETTTQTQASLAASLRKAIVPVMKLNGVSGNPAFDPKMITLIAFCAARDIVRLAIYQESGINVVKVYSYLCFWVRKLKPIQDAKDKSGDSIHDINERLSLWLLAAFIADHYELAEKKAAKKRFDNFIKSGELFDYTVHSMQRRTFGPHHYTILARSICET